MEKSFNNMKDEEVINMYHILISELKERNIIRTKNIVGDLGEYIAINWYNEHKELPKLKLQKNSNKDIDAESDKEKYAIKTTTGNCTGSFHGVDKNKKIFDKLIIIQLDEEYAKKRIIELDWKTFNKRKYKNKRTNSYYISITKKLLNEPSVIVRYDTEKDKQ